jgi:two-component system, chemotaxis family, chemotaxis protein CheY
MAAHYVFGCGLSQVYNGKKMISLLVADDAPFIREIVRNVAEKNDIQIVGEAINGTDAVELALRLKPDVILMDIIMPVKSGIEATKEILAQMPSARIIAFSTADQETMVVRALEAGCRSYVVKPFTADDLLSAIRNSLLK